MENKKILILDEERFSRICSAILSNEGYETCAPAAEDDPVPLLGNGEFNLIITSYPFGSGIVKRAAGLETPVIVLTDHIDWDLLQALETLKNSCCLLKPLDYQKFKNLVKQLCRTENQAGAMYRIT